MGGGDREGPIWEGGHQRGTQLRRGMRRHWTVLPGTNISTYVHHTDSLLSRIRPHTHQGGQGAASPPQPSPRAHASHVCASTDAG